MNYLRFLLSLLPILPIWIAVSAQTQTPSPKTHDLCLHINSISIEDLNPTSLLKDVESASTAIIYAYNTIAGESSFKSLELPIISKETEDEIEKDIEKGLETAAKEGEKFIMKLPEMDPLVGCWEMPKFNELNLRFKIYQYYHTAMKAVSSVLIPAISKGPATQMISLKTLEGEMRDIKVEMQVTLSWMKHHVELHAPITPLKPIDKPFDSEEITDNMMAMEEKRDEEPIEDVVSNGVDPAVSQQSQENDDGESTDWMFVAACMSAVLGGIILCYICIWAYKSFGRMGYEKIAYPTKCSKLKGIRRISLRNIVVNEESKNIMHPSVYSASYTFDD